jgi:uncharacterized membrane protein YkvA (DUF1232 family)
VDLGLVIAVVLSLVALWAVLLLIFWLLRPKGVPLRDVVRVVPDVLRLLRAVIGDRSAPLDVRFVVGGLFLWILSPIDLIPEFLPAIGPLDDVIVAVVALRYIKRRLGADDFRRRWPGTDDGLALLNRVMGAERLARPD